MTSNAPYLRTYYRDQTGAEGVFVIDELVDGAAIGGIRVTRTLNDAEVARLARAMSLKARALGLRVGGAKSGLRFDPKGPEKLDVIKRFFEAIGPYCREYYGFAPDMNTTMAEVDTVADHLGLPFRLQALVSDGDVLGARERYTTSASLKIGPSNFGYMKTGLGAFHVATGLSRQMGLGKSLRIAVQGFGSVGAAAAWFFEQAGHRVVAVSDAVSGFASDDGLGVKDLWAARNALNEIEVGTLPGSPKRIPRDSVLSHECDILVLAAVKDSITADNVARVRAACVVEAANIAVTSDATVALFSRGVPVVPDFVASGGGIVHAFKVIKDEFDWQDVDKLSEQVGRHMSDVAVSGYAASEERGLPIRSVLLPDSGELDVSFL